MGLEYLNFDSDVALADKIDDDTINATDPESEAVPGAKGKLLLYHGWADPGRRAARHRQLLQDALSTLSAASQDRRIPSGFLWSLAWAHCGGGEGPNSST